MGFFKTKLDNIPENTFENNPSLKGWLIRWSSQYFLTIFSMVHLILCYLIVPVQHPGTTQRLYVIDSTSQTHLMCCSWWIKKPLWECLASPSVSFPTLHLQGSGSVGLQGVQEHSTAHTQVLLRQTRTFPAPSFPFLSRACEHGRWHLTSIALGHVSAVPDDWGLAALFMVCSMAQGCLRHSMHSLPPQEEIPLFLQRSHVVF